MLSFHVIHARHSRRPSRSPVNLSSSLNRPVPVLSGSSWPPLPMFPLQPSTLNCQPRHSPSPLYVPISSSLSPSTATLMDPPRKCCRQKTYSKAKPFRCNTYKKPGGRGRDSGPRHSSYPVSHGPELATRPGCIFQVPFQLSTVDCQPPVTFHGSRKDSNPFLPPSCALSCTHQNSSCLFSCGCALFAKNHPGLATATSVNSAFSVASALIPIPCFSRGHGTRITHYRPARQLATRHSPLHQKGAALLTDFLLARGGDFHGFIHIGVGLFARITLALVAVLEVFKISLENSLACLAHAFSGSFVQRGFGPLLGRAIRMPRELHDRGVRAPITLILRVAAPIHLLVQRVNQQVVGPQDKHNPRDSQNREPLKQDAEPAPSPKFILADYSPPQAPPPGHGVHQYLHCAGMHVPQRVRWAAGADNGLRSEERRVGK